MRGTAGLSPLFHAISQAVNQRHLVKYEDAAGTASGRGGEVCI